jgi:flagella basal body P-ring formation protein FlgA
MDTTDADGRITLGDLFDGVSGPAANIVVAARMGPTAVLDAGQVQVSARRAGFDWTNSNGIRRIIVREGADNGGVSAGAGRAPPAPPAAMWKFLPTPAASRPAKSSSPRTWSGTKMAGAPMDAPRDADAIIGLAAKRPLREGAAAPDRDVAAAQVIKTGDMITVTYDDGGISLSLQGKAMAAAATGDLFAVQNTLSKKSHPGGRHRSWLRRGRSAGPVPCKPFATRPFRRSLRGHPPMRRPVIHRRRPRLLAPLAACSTVTEAVKGPNLAPVGYPAELAPMTAAVRLGPRARPAGRLGQLAVARRRPRLLQRPARQPRRRHRHRA